MATESAEQTKLTHGIAEAVDSFLHAINDIDACARMFVPLSSKLHNKELGETADRLKALITKIDTKDDKARAEAQAKFDRVMRKLERLLNSKKSTQLESSLFVGLFACYDAFFGKLLQVIFSKKNALFNVLDKTISLSQLASASTIDDLKAQVIDELVSDLRRKSYEDQFSSMESLFGLVLKKFPNYASFIEASQRRHLFTHCDGIVSLQYINCCKSAGYVFENAPKPGSRLKLGPEYFQLACGFVREVGAKLAHTLWRKLFPDELQEADKHLSDTIYSLLQRERWDQAIILGEFARAQKNVSDKGREKMYLVNYCIALCGGGKAVDAARILRDEDWSDAAPDFKLAKAVLLEDHDLACEIMKVIGKRGELVSEHAYHTWPLFRDFRSNTKFRNTYKAIYGYSFLEELKREAEKAKHEIEEAGAVEDNETTRAPVALESKVNKAKRAKPTLKKIASGAEAKPNKLKKKTLKKKSFSNT